MVAPSTARPFITMHIVQRARGVRINGGAYPRKKSTWYATELASRSKSVHVSTDDVLSSGRTAFSTVFRVRVRLE